MCAWKEYSGTPEKALVYAASAERVSDHPLAQAVRLARKTVQIMYKNIAIAVGTVLLLLTGLFAGYIHMSTGMLIHEASILAVIFNAMRLLIPRGKNKERNT